MVLFLDLSQVQYIYIGLAALIVGFTKTSVGGVGILAILLMALTFPGKASPGIILPMLLFADILAVIYYHRECQWGILLKIFPLTALGVVIGFFTVDHIPAGIFEKVLGVIILTMLVLELYISKQNKPRPKESSWFTISLIGIMAGIATMIANAAGPIFGIYLLQMGLTKKEFVGTRSWFFLILNIFKIPFSAGLGLITVETLKLDLLFVPIILFGAYLGYKVLNLINLKLFKGFIRVAVLVATIKLILF